MKKLMIMLLLATTGHAQLTINEQVHRDNHWKTTMTVNTAVGFVGTTAMYKVGIDRKKIFLYNMAIGGTISCTFEAVSVHYYGYKFDGRDLFRPLIGTLTGYAIGAGIQELDRMIQRRKTRPKLML